MSERNLKDLVGEVVTGDMENVTRALKLQESIKDMVKCRRSSGDPNHIGYNECMEELHSIVEESEK